MNSYAELLKRKREEADQKEALKAQKAAEKAATPPKKKGSKAEPKPTAKKTQPHNQMVSSQAVDIGINASLIPATRPQATTEELDATQQRVFSRAKKLYIGSTSPYTVYDAAIQATGELMAEKVIASGLDHTRFMKVIEKLTKVRP